MEFIIDNFEMLFESEQNLKKLEEIILDLAVKGKLVEQNPNDEPASVLIEKIKEEKERLIKEKKIKKPKKLEPINTEEIAFDIPKSWEWIKLGELAIFLDYRGKTPKKVESGIRLITAKNIKKGFISLSPEEFIESDNYYNWMSRGFPEYGDVIFTPEAPLGNVAQLLFEEKFALAQRAITLQTFNWFNKKMLMYILLSKPLQEIFIKKATGTTALGIKASKLKEVYIPIPPLEEQKRIVEKLDSLKKLIESLKEKVKNRDKTRQDLKKSIMSEIEKSDSNEELLKSLEMVFKNFDIVVKEKKDIKDIRDLILSMAVKGKLVEQNSNDEPASVLLEKIKEEKERLVKEKKIKKPKVLEPIKEDEISFAIPDSWEWVRFGELCKDIHYGYTDSAKQNDTGFKFLRITDIQNNKVNWETVPYCNIDQKKYKVNGLNNLDILIARTGGTIGKSYIVENLIGKAVFASYLIRAIPIKKDMSVYLKKFLETPIYWKQLIEKSQGTGQPNVNATSLKELKLPLPPLEEQKRIVEKVDKLMTLCDELEKKVEKSKTEYDILMKSVLQKVF